ncbi:MAG: molybdopterin molybdotransferase MoeA [Gammaproteobacteria bacterium]
MQHCCETAIPEPLDVGTATQRLLSATTALDAIEQIPLTAALRRVLAADQRAAIDVPGHDNSAMDGYALNSGDLDTHGRRLRISQRIPAGSTPGPLEPGTAARIFTGAPLPPGADTVVMQENCRQDGEEVVLPEVVGRGDHVRRAGEDIARGDIVLARGTRLAPPHIGLLASLGLETVPVVRRPCVAVISTGDELVEPGHALAAGQIFNSNRYLLNALLHSLGCDVVDLGRVGDKLPATVAALERAGGGADLVLSSGGVSVGEEDHVRAAVEQLGSLELWRINIKPGKPVAYGRVGNTPFLGLPGNPVSAFVTFCLFARPILLKLMGAAEVLPAVWRAPADFARPVSGARVEYTRARLNPGRTGRVVSLYPQQGSGVLSSAAWANALAIIPPRSAIRPGDMLDVLPFCELF